MTGAATPNVFQEYTGIFPSYSDSGGIGRTSPIAMVEHAITAMEAGMCSVAVVVQATSTRSMVGVAKPGRSDDSQTNAGQFLSPYGLAGEYTRHAMLTTRYLHTYGKTMQGFADLASSTRKWATLSPKAAFRDPISPEDVLSSEMISYPLTILMCCPRLDYAGAFIVTSAERAKDMKKKPVYVLGTAQAFEKSIDYKDDLIRWQNVRRASPRLWDMAGIKPKDIDIAQTHDAFIPVPVMELEGLGFCKDGEGLDFVSGGRTAPGGAFPMNTNGGGLSFNHAGEFGCASIIETVEQLRGESLPAKQVKGAKTGLVAGSSGNFTIHTDVIISTEQKV
jgi:acetyl-CoA acetyltransferase